MQKLWKQYMENGMKRQEQELILPETRIELSVLKGQNGEGSFIISGSEKKQISGRVYTTNHRMQVHEKEIEGERIEISYTFVSKGLQEQSVIKGEFIFLTDCGEYSLPFVASVDSTMVVSSAGRVKNLYQFMELAEKERLEATSLFYKPEFSKLLKPAGENKQLLYDLLTENKKDKELELEEFLKETLHKQPATCYLDSSSIELEQLEKNQEIKIPLIKDGNGYLEIALQVEGEFLSCSKQVLREEDFIGRTCQCEVIIHKNKLHNGKNMGRVIFNYGKIAMAYAITVRQGESWGVAHRLRREKKSVNRALLQRYLQFQKQEITRSQWVKESLDIVHVVNTIDNTDPFYILLMTQYYIINKEIDKAVDRMSELKSRKLIHRNDYVNYAYYLYLSSMLDNRKSHIRKNLEEILSLRKEYPDNFALLWFTLYMDETYETNLQKKYMCIEAFCEKGHIHPILYAEALQVLEQDAFCMHDFNVFAQRLVWWAIKQGRVSEELRERAMYLIHRQKSYTKRMYDILEYFYKESKDEEIVALICAMLVKSNRTDEKAFYWYRLGVQKGVAITKLYEFYLDSVPEGYEQPFEREIFLYFAMDSKLSPQKKNILYSNLSSHKEEYPDLNERFRIAMEMHIREQLCGEKVSKELMQLYKNCLPGMTITNDMWEPLSHLSVLKMIEMTNKRIRNVIVRHSLLEKEESFPVYRDRAWIGVYSDSFEIVLEDFEGKRFPYHQATELEEVIPISISMEIPLRQNIMNVGVALCRCFEQNHCRTVTESNIESARYLIEQNVLNKRYHIALILEMIEYYRISMRTDALELLIQEISSEELLPGEFEKITDYLIVQGADETAYQWVTEVGYEAMSKPALLRLCSRKIADAAARELPLLLEMAYHLFVNEKYDEKILDFLITYYEGPVKIMADIFRAGKEFNLDVCKLAERVLMQVTLTGAYLENLDSIFQFYVESGSRESVLRAFYTYQATASLKDSVAVSDSIWQGMEKLCMEAQLDFHVCGLAICRYYSEKSELTKEQIAYGNRVVRAALLNDCFMSCFLKLPLEPDNMFWIQDKCIVEFTGTKNPKLHYVLDEKDKADSFVQEEMKPVIDGIFSKEIILFSGEQLHYYITQRANGNEEPVESNQVSKDEAVAGESSCRYNCINDMLVSLSLNDYDTLQLLTDRYFREVYLANRLFTIR